MKGCVAVVVGALMLIAPYGIGAQERTIEELKAETLERAKKNQYPITEVKVADVEAALARITSKDPEQWGREWSRVAEPYERQGNELAQAGKRDQALAAYYHASRYYYLGRWPVPDSPAKKDAYRGQIRAYLAAARLFDPPLERVVIPFEGRQIVGYLRVPTGVAKPPVVFHWGGIDGWKEDARPNTEEYLAAGFASFVVDIPGTGESPMLATPDADRLFSRAIDHLQQRPELDGTRIAVQGSSWGGYWAAKLAHVERRRLRGAVNWGGPIHHYFQPEWQRTALETREYLFGLFEARAALYGVTTRAAFLDFGPKMSLKALGVLDGPSAPLLSVNGKNDSQVPIADLHILAESGSPKQAWINPAGGHMGRGPGGAPVYVLNSVIVPWLRTQLR